MPPTETVEAPTTEVEVAAPEPQETTQTEEPTTEVVAEPAAEVPEAAAAPQLEVTEPEKPEYMTRADWEREKAEVAQRAAQDALEADRRRRQTENARKAKAEQDRAERRERAMDTVKSAFGARGIYEVPDDAVVTAISRVAQDEAQAIAGDQAELLRNAMKYALAPVYDEKVEWDESYAPVTNVLMPELQKLVNTIRPALFAEAREGYIAESELPARVEAEIARRNAKAREGQEELRRPEGAPATTDTASWWRGLSAREKQDPANQARYDQYTASLS